jgi:hypothetical protein
MSFLPEDSSCAGEASLKQSNYQQPSKQPIRLQKAYTHIAPLLLHMLPLLLILTDHIVSPGSCVPYHFVLSCSDLFAIRITQDHTSILSHSMRPPMIMH